MKILNIDIFFPVGNPEWNNRLGRNCKFYTFPFNNASETNYQVRLYEYKNLNYPTKLIYAEFDMNKYINTYCFKYFHKKENT